MSVLFPIKHANGELFALRNISAVKIPSCPVKCLLVIFGNFLVKALNTHSAFFKIVQFIVIVCLNEQGCRACIIVKGGNNDRLSASVSSLDLAFSISAPFSFRILSTTLFSRPKSSKNFLCIIMLLSIRFFTRLHLILSVVLRLRNGQFWVK